VRTAPVFAFALVASLVAAACSGDDSTGGGSNSAVPPSTCPAEPCTVGALCYGPVEPSCNGSWYCWSDTKWHCAPQDSGGPADATLYETSPEDDGPDETSPAMDAAEAGPG
jgi:hypothetical protein